MRPWRFVVLWIALFSVALSTGVELLSYLSYLVLFVAAAMWMLSKMTLGGLSVKRAIGQTYAHLGDTIELTYELTNSHRFAKMWLEVFERSNWPEPLPGRVLSIGGEKNPHREGPPPAAPPGPVPPRPTRARGRGASRAVPAPRGGPARRAR